MVYIKFNYCKFIFKMSKLFDNFRVPEELQEETERERQRFDLALGTSTTGYMM